MLSDSREPAHFGLTRRRLHPFDVAIFALAVTVVVYLAVTIPGYHWAGSVQSGFQRQLPVLVTIEITDPTAVRLTASLARGRIDAETGFGTEPIRLEAVETGPGPAIRLQFALTATIDGSGRKSWANHPLRLGQQLTVVDAERTLGGTVIAIVEQATRDTVPPATEPVAR